MPRAMMHWSAYMSKFSCSFCSCKTTTFVFEVSFIQFFLCFVFLYVNEKHDAVGGNYPKGITKV